MPGSMRCQGPPGRLRYCISRSVIAQFSACRRAMTFIWRSNRAESAARSYFAVSRMRPSMPAGADSLPARCRRLDAGGLVVSRERSREHWTVHGSAPWTPGRARPGPVQLPGPCTTPPLARSASGQSRGKPVSCWSGARGRRGMADGTAAARGAGRAGAHPQRLPGAPLCNGRPRRPRRDAGAVTRQAPADPGWCRRHGDGSHAADRALAPAHGWLMADPAGRPPPRDHRVRLVLANDTWQAVGYLLADVRVVSAAQESLLTGHLGPDL